MPDDFQPHVNIKKMFNAGMLSTEEDRDAAVFREFCCGHALDQDILHIYKISKNKAAFLREQGSTQNKSIN